MPTITKNIYCNDLALLHCLLLPLWLNVLSIIFILFSNFILTTIYLNIPSINEITLLIVLTNSGLNDLKIK
jgi:hypothetical protein